MATPVTPNSPQPERPQGEPTTIRALSSLVWLAGRLRADGISVSLKGISLDPKEREFLETAIARQKGEFEELFASLR